MSLLINPYTGGGAAPPTYSTLNPTDTSGSALLLSGNLKLQANTALAAAGSRSNNSRASGKLYFETTNANGLIYPGDLSAGIANSSALLSNQVGFSANGVGALSSGAAYAAGGFLGSPAAWSTMGDVCQIAVDLGSKLFWARVNGGNWNGSGVPNPATGTGGYSWAFGGPYFVMVGVYDDTQPDAVLVNFGATAFSGAVPVGFSAWG